MTMEASAGSAAMPPPAAVPVKRKVAAAGEDGEVGWC